MNIPTEPIGSMPRPLPLIEAVARLDDSDDPSLDALYENAVRDTVERFEAAGSPVISPFSDDTSTSRDAAFSKIRARRLGTRLAERMIAGH